MIKFNDQAHQEEILWEEILHHLKLVYQKGLKLNSAPILLYGYGSYGITIPDVFNPILILERSKLIIKSG